MVVVAAIVVTVAVVRAATLPDRHLAGEKFLLTDEQLNWLLDGYDIWTQPHQMLRFQHVS